MSAIVLVIDDHVLYREALVDLVRRSGEHLKTITAACAEEGLALCGANPGIRLVLLDVCLPGISGIEAIPHLQRALPMAAIVVLTGWVHRRDIDAAKRAGAAGFVCKTVAPSRLSELLRRVLYRRQEGCEVLVDPATAAYRVAPGLPTLSERQRQVLGLLVQGLTNKAISSSLGLAEVTVKIHVSAIMKRFGVSNRTQVVIMARRFGMTAEHPGFDGED